MHEKLKQYIKIRTSGVIKRNYFLFLGLYHVVFLLALAVAEYNVWCLAAYSVLSLNKTMYIWGVKRKHKAFIGTVFSNPSSFYQDFHVDLRKVMKHMNYVENSIFLFDPVFLMIITILDRVLWIPLTLVLLISWDLIPIGFFWKYVKPVKQVTEKYFKEHNSEVIVYLSGINGIEFHLDQWISALGELKYRKTIVLRNKSFLDYGTYLDIPVVMIESYNTLLRFLSRNEKIVFYVNNDAKNFQMLENGNCKHVLLLHGESDKGPSFSRAAVAYDYLFVAGKAAISRYYKAGIRVPRDKFKVIGRPQLSVLKNTRRKPSDLNRRTVLYAPTFEGAREDESYSSLESLGSYILEEIMNSDLYRLIVKLHPKTGSFSKKYGVIARKMEVLVKRNRSGGHVWIDSCNPNMTLYECFIESDILISDVSSVPIDYLVLNRPIIATNPFSIEMKTGLRDYPFWRGCYVLDRNTNILELIGLALKSDSKRKEREKIARYYLGPSVFSDTDLISYFRDTVNEIMVAEK